MAELVRHRIANPIYAGSNPVGYSINIFMNFDTLILVLSIILLFTVGAYVYKKEFDTPPTPKPEIRYYHINF